MTYQEAPLLVLAGPGSGKTRIITHRIPWLIRERDARPESILAVTFTNRAAEEMRDRLESILGEDAGRVWVYTFHAAAVRILRKFGERIGIDPNFAILDEEDQRHLINHTVRQLGLSREHYSAGRVLSYIGERKNALADPTEPYLDADPALIGLAESYEQRLREQNALDFDDLIRYVVLLLRREKEVRDHYHHTLRHILVDEYQDINYAQYELLKLLAPLGGSITVVADDDQAIYRWRGSKPELIDSFRRRYHPHEVRLDISYRCPPSILYGAQGLVSRSRDSDHRRAMRSHKREDAPIFHYIFHDIGQEQRWLVALVRKLIEERAYKPGDIAVLYRTHRLAQPVEQALLQAGFKVQRVRKESFFDRRTAREVVRYMQLMRMLTDENFTSAINFPVRLVDELTMIHLQRLAEREGVSLVDLARRAADHPDISPLTRVHLSEFIRLVEEDLPDPSSEVEPALQQIFEVLAGLRSPWRENDIRLLEGFMAFTDLTEQAQALAIAIREQRPIIIVHENSLDARLAAFILQDALKKHLDVIARTITSEALAANPPEPEAALITLGSTESASAGEIITVADDEERVYPLVIYAWRLAQRLLMQYETQIEGRFVVYDVETTGTNIRRDELVEIAAARYEHRQPIAPSFEQLIRPQRGYIPPAASKVHGIYFEDVVDAPAIEQVLPEFLAYVGEDVVVGHNIARFDNRFIDRACGQLFNGKGFHPHYIDTLRLARRLLPGLPRYTLTYLLQTLNLGDESDHRAMHDVEHTANLFYALADRLLEERERESLVEYLPLVGMGLLSVDAIAEDENLALLSGAARLLAAGRGQAEIRQAMAALPPEFQGEAQSVYEKICAQQAPITREDEAWEEMRQAFFTHAKAFSHYSHDHSLAAFIDYQALLTNRDAFRHIEEDNALTLMTLHNAKGAEFPVVIIVGVEQDNLPLWRSLDDPEELAEERRVFYVGITRAKDAVYLFSVRDRNDGFLRGPSPFAFEIPNRYVRRFRVDAHNRVREMR
ncbi:MAG: UvrD-helicase domain-containing protein [Chloroflexi bacterium]|nr:UvrD-helicase domain-containing protein [Chloroflexota bacterium]